MNNTRKAMGLMLALVFVVTMSSCAKNKNDIDTTSNAAKVKKVDLAGEYSYVSTLTKANEELASDWLIPGLHNDFGYVRFEITESKLRVIRINEINRPRDQSSLVAEFPITSHFDIKRETNDFNENTNKIIEDTRRPWNEREFMRVDWGTNLATSTSLANIFNTEIKQEAGQVVTALKKESDATGEILSFDVDATIQQTESFDRGDGEFEYVPVGSLRAQMKHSFRKLVKSDYKAYEMTNKDFNRFGFFRSYENYIDPDGRVTITGRKLFANRFNVCEAGTGRSCSRGEIMYVLNKDFPAEYLPAARDVVNAWNKSFQKALDRSDRIVWLNEDIRPEIGDNRYNMIAALDEKVPTGLLGVSQTTNNPSTGETHSARSTIYLGAVKLIAGNAADQLAVVLTDGHPGDGKSQSLKSLDLTKEVKGMNAKEIPKLLKAQRKILKTNGYKPDLSIVKPNINTARILKARLKDTEGNAAASRAMVFSKPEVAAKLNIDDPAWYEAGYDARALKDVSVQGKEGRLRKFKELSKSARGIHTSEFVEPAVEHFVRKFAAQHQGQPLEQIQQKLKAEARQLIFYTTLIHEMGHNFGLRHNFGGSSDKKHYTDKWNQLEKEKIALAQANPNDPRIAELALEQESFDFASVMDYAGGFHEALGGTGHYDDAAIRFGYNTSINQSADEVTGVQQNYKFCTDHQVFEDPMCARWDKGSNVNQASARVIAQYDRDYSWRHNRRNRANFGNPMSHLWRTIQRTMLPLRLVTDEFIYQFIVSPTVPANANQCDIKFLRDSIDKGEMGNICDNAVVEKYMAAFGTDFSDWADFVLLLLNPKTGDFLKPPASYLPNGFADLMLSNNMVGNYFVNVVGMNDSGLYLPIGQQGGVTVFDKLPLIYENNEQNLMFFYMAQGLNQNQAQQLVNENKNKLVDLKKGGPNAKDLVSTGTYDGSYFRVETLGYEFDKLAAILIMGARGMPVDKYQRISLNGNMYFAPQTKTLTLASYNALITEPKYAMVQSVVNVGGESVDAALPASWNLTTKVYGAFYSVMDLVSDQNHEYADKMRVCVEGGSQTCVNELNLPEVKFSGANGQKTFKALQVRSNDGISYNLIEKGDLISKARDQAVKDVTNHDQLVTEMPALLNGSAAGQGVADRQKAFMALVKQQSPTLVKKIDPYYGSGFTTFKWWQLVMDEAQALNETGSHPGMNVRIQELLPDVFSEADQVITNHLASNPTLAKSLIEASAKVKKDMVAVNTLTVRIIAPKLMIDKYSEQLQPLEDDAIFIDFIYRILGIQ
ncbi:MAG: hypothetical protein SGI74_13265 [Oligoflexia bacterium]|nr:hypothetical protein [Oligoflexia bacterium]